MLRSLLCAALLLAPVVARAEATGEIDWQRRVIKARGQGAPDLNAPSISVARLGAERAAKLDALRNLLETLRGATLSSGSNAGTLLQNDKTLQSKVEGSLRGFKVVAPHYFSDGGVALDVEVDIDKLPVDVAKLLTPPAGAAAPAAGDPKSAPKAEAAKGDAAATTAGFIIDLTDSKVAPGRAPRVLDESGAQVYGPDVVNADKLAAGGQGAYAGFAKSLDAARKDARLSGAAAVLKAVRVSAPGGDVVVSAADADKLRKGQDALEGGRVVFVVP